MHITTVANLYGNNNAFHNFESPLMLSCLQWSSYNELLPKMWRRKTSRMRRSTTTTPLV
jgi:hypothetical protein